MASKTEKEKMLAGELYIAEDPTLRAEREHALALLHRYNSTPWQQTTHHALLAQLLGACGNGSVIKPPFFCDYGFNISLGRGVFLNYNCVLLDVNPITIGDQTQIGPPCRSTQPIIPAPRRPAAPASKVADLSASEPMSGSAAEPSFFPASPSATTPLSAPAASSPEMFQQEQPSPAIPPVLSVPVHKPQSHPLYLWG